MTRNELIDDIQKYLKDEGIEVNGVRLYSREGVEILLKYMEDKLNESDNVLKLNLNKKK